jgi:hypothetical protein
MPRKRLPRTKQPRPPSGRDLKARAEAVTEHTRKEFHMRTLFAVLLLLPALALGETTVHPRQLRTDVVNVKDAPYNAKCDGVTDDTAAFASARGAAMSAGAGVDGQGKVLSVPAGKCRVNLSIAGSQITIRGAGRRSTILIPATNAPVITLDSTATAIQSSAIEDIGFDATGTGFTSPAIKIVGINTNDWHTVRRSYMKGFTKAIHIAGRTIWSRFEDVEIQADLSNGFHVETSAPMNHLSLRDVRVGNAAGAGIYFKAPGSGDDPTFKTIVLDHCNSEANGSHGVYAENVDSFTISGGYIENNTGAGTAAVYLAGTYARGINISGAQLWGSAYALWNSAALTTGEFGGNTLGASIETIHIATTHDDSKFQIGANHDTGVHSVAADVNGNRHVTSLVPLVLDWRNETAAADVSVKGRNLLRFTTAGTVTINRLTNADPGQILHISMEGAGTVTLAYAAGGGDGQFNFPGAASIALTNKKTAALVYDGVWWRPLSSVAY